MTKNDWQRAIEIFAGVGSLTAGCWLVAPHWGLIVFGVLCLVPSFATLAHTFRRGPS